MKEVASDASESDQPNGEIAIRVVVPEEFCGWSVGEFQSRGGSITGMEVQSGCVVVIRGSLPVSEYPALQDAVRSATQQRGKVERDPT